MGVEEKCIVSGCSIPARGILRVDAPSLEFRVCGVHRRAVSEMMNRAAEIVYKARNKAIAALIVELDEMGDHRAEDELALAQ